MSFASTIGPGRALMTGLLMLVCAGVAHGTDRFDPATRQLSIPTLGIGAGTLSNVVVIVGSIVSGPSGSAPDGSEDSYDPATNQLKIQAVTAGLVTYYNVVVTVTGLVSIGAVSGTVTYAGTDLSIP